MKAILGLFGLLALVFAAPASASAPPPPQAHVSDASIDDIVRGEMARQHIPGLALAVLRDGQVVLSKGYGEADVENGIAVSSDTAFSIGSLSKQFLAAAVMLLVEDGKVDLNDSIVDSLPDAPESWRPITIRHLLNHTSGLVREGPAFQPGRLQPDINIIRSAYEIPLLFQIGERFEYSNLGYFIIAEVISRRSGMAWPDFVKTRIFDPAGMSGARLTSDIDDVPHRSGGYEWRDGRTINVTPFVAVRPSGAFVASLADLGRWDQALDAGGVLPAASSQQMWTASRFNDGTESAYGLGWRLEKVGSHFEVGHGGSLPGFRSYYARYPNERLSVIVLTNEGNSDPRSVARTLAELYLID